MEGSIEVLKEFRYIAQIFALYNRENFKVSDRKTCVNNILAAFIFVTLLVCLGLLIVSAVWHSFDYNFAINKTAFALPVCFRALQTFLIYFTLVASNRKITKTITRLQNVINKRKILLCSSH